LHLLRLIIIRKFKIDEHSLLTNSHRLHAQPSAIYCQYQFNEAQQSGLERARQTAGFYNSLKHVGRDGKGIRVMREEAN